MKLRFLACLALLPLTVGANEAGRGFSDSAWQFQTETDRVYRLNQAGIIWGARHTGYAGTGSAGSGSGLGSVINIGNMSSVTVDGDGNQVSGSDQDNSNIKQDGTVEVKDNDFGDYVEDQDNSVGGDDNSTTNNTSNH